MHSELNVENAQEALKWLWGRNADCKVVVRDVCVRALQYYILTQYTSAGYERDINKEEVTYENEGVLSIN